MKPIIIRGPCSLREWIATYRDDIRPIVDWERLASSGAGVYEKRIVGPKGCVGVFYPKYRTGGWMQGGDRKAVTMSPSPSSIIVQAPAVSVSVSSVVLLDGCHRIAELDPFVIVLDVVIADSPEIASCFADLLRP